MLNERTALSEREMEILRLVATGATNQEIARQLVISINTVKVHLRNIFEKLEVTSRTEATMVAVRQGWVVVPGQLGAIEPKSEEEQAALALPLMVAEPLPLTIPVARVSAAKRIGLALAVAVMLSALVLPPVLESKANGGKLDPIRNVFPVWTNGLPGSRWHSRAHMPTARTHLAVVTYGGLVYAIGGVGAEGVTGKVEVYDPQTDGWSARRAKPTPAGFISAAVLDGKIYVPGGMVTEGEAATTLEVYNPATDTWDRRAPLPRALASYGLAVFGGQLYVFGGMDGKAYVPTVYRYDPAADWWRELPAMDGPRGLMGIATLKDRIYLVGGFDGTGETNTCSIYDPAAATWSNCAPMAMRRSGLSMVAVRDALYVVGGSLSGYLAFNERYDPKVDVWTRIETPVVDRWLGAGTAFVMPYIYVIGGWNGTTLSTNEAYQALYVVELNP